MSQDPSEPQTGDSRVGTSWFRTPLARRLLACERVLLQRVLPDIVGFYAFQLGAWGDRERDGGGTSIHLARTQIRALATAQPFPPQAGRTDLRCGSEVLPFVNDGVDGVLLPHTLERTEDPRRLLREVHRILVPEGSLVLMGLNPRSLWGLRRALSRRRFPVGVRQLIRERQVRDWLEVLGFSVQSVHRYAFRPPIDHARTLDALRWMERRGPNWLPSLAGGYMIVARKREAAMTPLRPVFRMGRELGGVAEPAG
jgi:SAM-dependent methyltransferase